MGVKQRLSIPDPTTFNGTWIKSPNKSDTLSHFDMVILVTMLVTVLLVVGVVGVG